MIKITITENQGNQRLDRFLKKYFDRAPLSHIYKLIRQDVKVNGKRQKEDTMLAAGDELTIYLSEEDANCLLYTSRIHWCNRYYDLERRRRTDEDADGDDHQRRYLQGSLIWGASDETNDITGDRQTQAIDFDHAFREDKWKGTGRMQVPASAI